jgi:hypothetical protein
MIEQSGWQQQRQQRAFGHSNGEEIELEAETMLSHNENRYCHAIALK